MSCITPYFVRNKAFFRQEDRFTKVPCGKCSQCLRRRATQWIFRLQQEEKISTSAYFVTLTYNEDNVPLTDHKLMTLNKLDFQKFIKLLRKWSPNDKLRYYAVGEYGSESSRPHYHVILFNLSDSLLLNRFWLHGAIDIGDVSGASIAYVTNYVEKARVVPVNNYDDREKEFSVMSKGLGLNYVSDRSRDWHFADPERFYLPLAGGGKVALPRYYRDKIYASPTLSASQLKKAEQLQARFKALMEGKVSVQEHARLKKYVKKYGSLDGFTRSEYDSVNAELKNFHKRKQQGKI